MSTAEKSLHADIPVKLSEVKAVFSFGARPSKAICGIDLPPQIVSHDIAEGKAKAQVIAVFHTNAGHVTLHDSAYNADRNIATSNPHKKLLADLMPRGVEVEICSATAKAHHQGNADLLSGIEVNTDAMARATRLVQQGFVKITE